ncbi:hypothetical protein [Microcoleus phage My-WqHQDG]|nr:hypothetical protein [Microcoleus phage My-WqHQDG]
MKALDSIDTLLVATAPVLNLLQTPVADVPVARVLSSQATVTLDQLRAIKVPKSTFTYTPVPHHEVVETLLQESAALGLEKISSVFTTRKGGRQLFLSITFAGSNSKEYEWSLVGINSYDKSLALRLGGGLRTMVCTNLSLSGDYEYYHKHTPGVSLSTGAKAVLSGLPSICTALEKAMASMKVPITKAQGAYFILQWGKTVALSKQHIYTILELWENPSYPEFLPYQNQVYGLYQAVTTLCGGWDDGKKYPVLQSLAQAIEGWVW